MFFTNSNNFLYLSIQIQSDKGLSIFSLSKWKAAYMAQLQQQLRLNESHLVLAPLSLLQFKLISSQKFSSTSKHVLHHFILISSFLVHPRSLWSTSYIQAPIPKPLYFFRNVWRAIWWWNSMVIRNLTDIWIEYWILKYQWEKWCEES